MPQTKEHLAILDLLKVPAGVVALTKSDLVEAEWLGMMKDDIRKFLTPSILKGAPIIPVSSKTGEGIDELKRQLGNILNLVKPRLNNSHPRLPIDRIFTITGFGTVVTGTLLDGFLKVGEEVEVAPQGLRGRIRGLQTYKKKVIQAGPGSRVAVNLSGLDVAQIKRGNVLIEPGQYQPTTFFDAKVEAIHDSSRPLKHGEVLKIFQGTTEVMAHIRLLKVDELQAGETGWAQFETKSPLLILAGDKFIIRRPSPAETIGGGAILNPHPSHRYHRKDSAILELMESYDTKDTEGIIAKILERKSNSPKQNF